MTWRRAGVAAAAMGMWLMLVADPAGAVPSHRLLARRHPIVRVVTPHPGVNAHLGARVVRDVGGDRSGIALTFDDGPDPHWTPEVLDVLDAFHVHATFFVVGRAAARYPDLVHEISARGNVVAL